MVVTLDEAAAPDLAELSELAELASTLEGLGHPVIRIGLSDLHELGAEFLRWEVATAAAGMVLGIDPFDQPNVQESKDATRELLDAFRAHGSLPAPPPIVAEAGLSAVADAAVLGDDPVTVDGALRALMSTIGPGDYFAVLAYLPQDPDAVAALDRVRALVRDGLGNATTAGFGPRFLHSTGQLHKGGPANGVFLQLTAEPQRDLPIPGWQESFGTLIAAQALGDLPFAAGPRPSRPAPARRRHGNGAAARGGGDCRRAGRNHRHLSRTQFRGTQTEASGQMQVGIAGLGRMGAGMARRLARAGHQVVAWNRTEQVAIDVAAEPENDGRITVAEPIETIVEQAGGPAPRGHQRAVRSGHRRPDPAAGRDPVRRAT